MRANRIVTFTSDFGAREPYVGAVKGAILSACPTATIVDISHEVGSHDLLEAAYVVACAYPYFPLRTVHLVVVDPTVGSGRRGVILWTEGAVFVAPDNGVLSMVYQREEVRRVLSIEAEHYFRKPVSATFHGRDVFGPVAGWIAHGTDVDNFGPEITDFVRFAMPSPKLTADKRVEGVVLHVDKFGNVITNITVGDLCRLLHRDPEPVAFRINGREIRRHCSYYSEVQGDELFSLLGSSGYYEIAAFRKPAARLLEARRGMRVELEVR